MDIIILMRMSARIAFALSNPPKNKIARLLRSRLAIAHKIPESIKRVDIILIEKGARGFDDKLVVLDSIATIISFCPRLCLVGLWKNN